MRFVPLFLAVAAVCAELRITSNRLWRFNTLTSEQYMFGTADFPMLRPMEQDDVYVYEFGVGVALQQNDTIHLEVAFGNLPSYNTILADAFEVSFEFSLPGQYIGCIDTACSTPTTIALADTIVSLVTGLPTIQFQVMLYTLDPRHTGNFGIIMRVLSATAGANARPVPPVITTRLFHPGFDATASVSLIPFTAIALTKYDISIVGTDVYNYPDFFPLEDSYSYLWYVSPIDEKYWHETELPLTVDVQVTIPHVPVNPVYAEMVLAVRIALRQDGETQGSACLLPVLAPYCQCAVIAPLQFNEVLQAIIINASLSCPRGAYTYDQKVLYISVVGPSPNGTYNSQSGFQPVEIADTIAASSSYITVTAFRLTDQVVEPDTTTLFPTMPYNTPTTVFPAPLTDMLPQMSSNAYLVYDGEGPSLAPHGSVVFPLQFEATAHDGMSLVRVVYVFDNIDSLIQGDEITVSATFGFRTPAHILPSLTAHFVFELHEWEANLPCLASPSCRRTTHVPVSYINGTPIPDLISGTVTLTATLPIRNTLTSTAPFAIGVRVINSTGDNPLVFPCAVSVELRASAGYAFFSRSASSTVSALPSGSDVYAAGPGQATLASTIGVEELPSDYSHALQLYALTTFNDTIGPSMLAPASLHVSLTFRRLSDTIAEFGRIFAYRVSWLTNTEAMGAGKWCAVPLFGTSCACSALFPVTANDEGSSTFYKIEGSISCPRNVVMSGHISFALVNTEPESDPATFEFSVPVLEDAASSVFSLEAFQMDEITTEAPTESPTSVSPVTSVGTSSDPSTTQDTILYDDVWLDETASAADLVIAGVLVPYGNDPSFAIDRMMEPGSPRAIYTFLNRNAFPQHGTLIVTADLGLSAFHPATLPDSTIITLELHEYPPNLQCLMRYNCRKGTHVNISGPYSANPLTGVVTRTVFMPIPVAFRSDGAFIVGMRVVSTDFSSVYFTFPPTLSVVIRVPTPDYHVVYESVIDQTFTQIYASNLTRQISNIETSSTWPDESDGAMLPTSNSKVVYLGVGSPPALPSGTAFYASIIISVDLSRNPVDLIDYSGGVTAYRFSWLSSTEATGNSSCVFPVDNVGCECSAIFPVVQYDDTYFRIHGVLSCPESRSLSGVVAISTVGSFPHGSPLVNYEPFVAYNGSTSTFNARLFLVEEGAPPTVSPVTESPTSLSPMTESPTSLSPGTGSPVTESPTSLSPVTESPTSISPVSVTTTTEQPVASLGGKNARITLIVGVTVAAAFVIVLVNAGLVGCAKYGSYQLLRS